MGKLSIYNTIGDYSNADDIINEFMRRSNHYVFPNTYIGHYECDILEITKAGYAYEYEVKTSRSDFKSDANKIWKSRYHNTIISIKSDLIKQGKRVNHFYYVCPANLIRVNEIPEYAGLIYVKTYEHSACVDYRIIKNAPKLSKEKLGGKLLDKCFKSTYYRFHKLRKQFKKIKEL